MALMRITRMATSTAVVAVKRLGRLTPSEDSTLFFALDPLRDPAGAASTVSPALLLGFLGLAGMGLARVASQ